MDFTDIQAAIDYAADQGASQSVTGGTTEQGGTPWVVVVLPGEYKESGIQTRDGVNITSLMERTVLIASDANSPIIECNSNSTIAGITIEQRNKDYPALYVGERAVQCSVHRSILAGIGPGYTAIRQEGGFLRIFDSDVRKGDIVLAPMVNWPAVNPVGLNLLRCRMWDGDMRIEGPHNALFLLEHCHMHGASILSRATGHVDGRIFSTSGLERVQNTGTYSYRVRNSEISVLEAASPTSTVEVWGGYIENTSRTGRFITHTDARDHWLADKVEQLEAKVEAMQSGP